MSTKLFQEIQAYPIAVEWLIRTDTFRKVGYDYHTKYDCEQKQYSFDSYIEAYEHVSRMYHEWTSDYDMHGFESEHYIRGYWIDNTSFVKEIVLPWAIVPLKYRFTAHLYVRCVKAVPDPLDCDESSERWFLVTDSVLEGLDWFIKREPEPDSYVNWGLLNSLTAEPEQHQPETIIIPIPTWEWVETEPDPEPEQHQPEPDQDWEPTLITRGYLRVTVETHDKLVEGNKAFNLPYHRADAVWQAGVYTSEIRNRITDLIGFQPESQAFEKSPYWDMPDQDRGNWCEWICTWRADFYQGLERVTFEWGFDHDQPPFEAEEKEDSTEPLWLGCITVEQPKGKRSTCQASNHRFVISEWIKGGVETYALFTDYCGLDSEHIVGRHSLTDISRDGQSERDVNVTLGGLVGEGIRLL